MPNKKISQLDENLFPLGSDVFPVVNNGVTKKQSLSGLTNFVNTQLWETGSTGTGSIKAKNSTGTDATGDYSLAIGAASIASGDYSYAQGYNNTASGDYSSVFGLDSLAQGYNSFVYGQGLQGLGIFSFAVGVDNVVYGTASFVGGVNSHANGNYTFVYGFNSIVNGNNSIVLGSNLQGDNSDTTYVDNFNIKSVQNGVSIYNLGIDANGYVVIGSSGGSGGTSGTDVFVTGGTYANGITIFKNNTGGTFSVTGYSTGSSITNFDVFVTGGTYSAGTATFVNNTGGTFTVTGFNIGTGGTSGSTLDVFVTGGTYLDGTTTFINNTGGTFTVNGYESYWTAGTGFSSILTKNSGNVASGNYSLAEGQITSATNDNAHAEGSHTLASGESSHAEGAYTVASGYNSHAEGNFTYAIGDYSHAQGSNNTAIGVYSHVGGNKSFAYGHYSFVHGVNSQANVINTIVLGSNLTGTSADTTYVDGLNIKNLTGGTSINNLGIDANGKVVIGSDSGSGSTTFDVFVTGGTYAAGTASFRNNTGGTFNVTGFLTGSSNTNLDVFVTGGTYAAGTTTFRNNTGGTFTVNGYSTGSTSGPDVFVTGGTYSAGSTIFRNNTGGTFNVSGYSQGDMVKAVYDTLNLGIVDYSSTVMRYGSAQESIAIGDPVYVSSTSNPFSFIKRSKSNDPSTLPAVGIMIETVNGGQTGKVAGLGALRGINTNSYPVNTILFVGPNGGLTNIKPFANAQAIAVVARTGFSDGAIGIIPNLNIQQSVFANNLSTSALTSTQLNTAYPLATPGFSVHALSVTGGPIKYERSNTGWIQYNVTIVP